MQTLIERDVEMMRELIDENVKLRIALRMIIRRSHTDALGTSKVLDMRRIAEDAI